MSSCLCPIEIKNPRFGKDAGAALYVQVPCGKCVGCRRRMQNDWAYRIQMEAQNYDERTYFVTLSYDPESVPLVPDVFPDSRLTFETLDDISKLYTLNPADMDLYHKRLRHWYDTHVTADDEVCQSGRICRRKDLKEKYKPFRYFYCGEYGDTFDRPHYHEILFSSVKFDKIELSDILSSIWQKGIVEVSELTVRRSKYVAKYTLKSFEDDYTGRVSCYAQMSRMPGIGYNFINRYGQFIKDNKQYCLYDSQGTPYVLPRYYRDVIYSDKRVVNSIKKDGIRYAEDNYNEYDLILEDLDDGRICRTTVYDKDTVEAHRHQLEVRDRFEIADDRLKKSDPLTHRQKLRISERYLNNEYDKLLADQIIKRCRNAYKRKNSGKGPAV